MAGLGMGDLAGKIKTKYCLNEGEQLLVCPYDMAHHVTNRRITVHLIKCRKNYEKERMKRGELIQMISCKYNWTHQVPQPEIVYHERNCHDKDTVTTYTMRFTEPDPTRPGKRREVDESYMTKGIPPPKPEKYIGISAKQSVLSSYHSWSGMIGTSGIQMSRSGQMRSTKEEHFEHKLRLRSVSERTQIGISSKTYNENGQTVNAILEMTEEELEHIRQKRRDSFDDRSSICSSTVGTGAAAEDEDWETGVQFNAYCPMKLTKDGVFFKYPAGMSKSERVHWKDDNVRRLKEFHKGKFPNIEGALKPNEPIPDSTDIDFISATTLDMGISLVDIPPHSEQEQENEEEWKD